MGSGVYICSYLHANAVFRTWRAMLGVLSPYTRNRGIAVVYGRLNMKGVVLPVSGPAYTDPLKLPRSIFPPKDLK